MSEHGIHDAGNFFGRDKERGGRMSEPLYGINHDGSVYPLGEFLDLRDLAALVWAHGRVSLLDGCDHTVAIAGDAYDFADEFLKARSTDVETGGSSERGKE